MIEDSFPHAFEPDERRGWQLNKNAGLHVGLSSPRRSRRGARQCCMGYRDLAQRLDSRYSGGPGQAGRERVAWDLRGDLHPGENASGYRFAALSAEKKGDSGIT